MERHEDVPDQIHWCDAVLAATDIPDAKKAQLLYAAAMDYFGKWELVMLSLRDRTTEVDALKAALNRLRKAVADRCPHCWEDQGVWLCSSVGRVGVPDAVCDCMTCEGEKVNGEA